MTCLALLPGTGEASFPGTRWGISVAEVRPKIVDARIETLEDGGTFLRTTSQAFGGYAALTTLAFIPRVGLNLVVVEIVQPGTKVVFDTVDLSRPRKDAAAKIVSSLASAFTAKYGTPAQSESGPGGSTISWESSADLVLLSTRVLGPDCTDVRIWFRGASKTMVTSEGQRRLSEVFSKTDPATWSAGGGMNVRWGMGPGDVLALYPGLSEGLGSAVQPTRTYHAQAYIEGNVGLMFDFYLGRLYGVSVGATFRSSPRDLDDEQLQMHLAQSEHWGSKAFAILKEKYGAPLAAPSDEEVRIAMSPDARASELAWAWKKGATGIEFWRKGRAVQYVNYLAIDDLGRAARDADFNYKQAEAAKRKSVF